MIPKLKTTVARPVHRSGDKPYVLCCFCGFFYTKLGVSRHWDKCPARHALIIKGKESD